jgi:hypothetical protein
MIGSFILDHVEILPKEPEDGVLYASRKYSIAVHRCACGCRTPVYTPLKATEWRLTERHGLPSLTPSVGNWTLRCRSHYLITNGCTVWAGPLSNAQILAGRNAEVARRQAAYRTEPWWQRLLNAVAKLLKH